ncbi:hypothetical protein V8E36_006948 [Tilletia maclaganii]
MHLSRFAATLSAVLAATLPAWSHAHSMTKEEALAHADRQEAMYHCMPALQAYTLARKRQVRLQQGSGGSIPEMLHASTGAGRTQAIFSDDPTVTPNLFMRETVGGDGDGAAADLLGLGHGVEADAYFRIRNSTCVLAPEVTEGPYFHSKGHLIRRHMAEYQLGLPFIMNIGVIDVETCRPVSGALVDVWTANATGYYSGHPNPQPHLKDEKPASTGPRRGLLSAYPRTNEVENWLRAAYPTDKNGVVQFTSIFPGYYTGRATHVHARVYSDWTPLPNGSYVGGPLAHIGQFFFEDELNESIDKLAPYNENPIRHSWGRTRNWDDSLNIFHDSQAGGGYKPMFDIEFLGHVVQQGLIGYVTMGVNMSQVYQQSAWDPNSSKPKLFA